MPISLDLCPIVTINPHIDFSSKQFLVSTKPAQPFTLSPPHFYQTLRGTIVPPEWKSIHTKDGKKLSRGSLELYAIIVSWYNCKKVKDKETGRTTYIPKFEGDELKKNYDYFIKELDRSQEQVRRYFAELKSANLVTMELKTVRHKNWKYHNTLCITLNKEVPHFTKAQDDDCKTIDVKSCVSNVVNTSSAINQFDTINCASKIEKKPTTNNDSNDKKIWTSPHKKVDFTPQKSGVYIENNYFKTIKNRSDIGKSNFVEEISSKSSSQPSYTKIQTNNADSPEPSVELSPKSISKNTDINTNYPINNLSNFKKAMELGLKVNLSDRFPPSHLNQVTQPTKHSNFTNFAQSRSLPRKPLASFHPLSEEDAIFLRKESGRPFSLSFINKLLLKLSADYPDRGFYKKSLLLSYLTSSLIGEKRDACVVSCESFKFKSKLGSSEYDSKIQNNYLSAIELSLETNISTRIKRGIIGLFNDHDAYNILTNCHLPYIAEPHNTNSYKIEVSNSVTEAQRLLLTQAIRDVLKDTTEVIFEEIKDKKVGQGSFINASNNSSLNSELSEPIISSSPLWQKIRESLKKRYGDAIDKSWFSNLDIEQSPDNTKLCIKCPTSFVRDWIKTNYLDAIESAISELTRTAKELFPNIISSDTGNKYLHLECST